MSTGIRKWLAFGTGVGIEVGSRDLRAVAVRVRPNGVDLIGDMILERYQERPAAEWGSEYEAFARQIGVSHVAASVLLPRRDVIVRQIAVPGVSDSDLAAAVGYQIDSLHPYPEDEAVHTWARTGETGHVLVGIARREVIDRYIALFAEAGIKVASFTFSAASLFSSLRLLGAPPAEGFLALSVRGEEMEAYGESPSRPVFSAAFDVPSPAFADKARSLALSELRLPGELETSRIADVLPHPKRVPEGYDLAPAALPYAAAVASACPRLSLPLNLLPEQMRMVSSRAMYVPTIVLSVLVILGAGSLWGYTRYEDQQYRNRLEAEIARIEPLARKALTMDQAIDKARARTLLLDDFRKRTRADLDALNELTRIMQQPTWVSALELTRDGVRLNGETDQAAALLKIVDKSPLFEGSEFTAPIARVAAGETFGIRARREGAIR